MRLDPDNSLFFTDLFFFAFKCCKEVSVWMREIHLFLFNPLIERLKKNSFITSLIQVDMWETLLPLREANRTDEEVVGCLRHLLSCKCRSSIRMYCKQLWGGPIDINGDLSEGLLPDATRGDNLCSRQGALHVYNPVWLPLQVKGSGGGGGQGAVKTCLKPPFFVRRGCKKRLKSTAKTQQRIKKVMKTSRVVYEKQNKMLD